MIIPYTIHTVPESWSLDKWNEYAKIISSFTTFSVIEKHQQWILEALHDSKTWDWFTDCNGANVVSEPGWKGKFSPPYVKHDYDCEKKGISLKANSDMKELQEVYGMGKIRSCIRWFGVTAFGLPYYKMKNWITGLF